MKRSVAVQFGVVVATALGFPACCSLPSYTPKFWNDGGIVQDSNNCYNYANNRRTDTYAQPGRRSAYPPIVAATTTCENVSAAAISDGLSPAQVPATCGQNDCATRCPDDACKLALVVGDGDYHWYRLDKNGMWSHKPGATQATDHDNAANGGNAITNPENADRGCTPLTKEEIAFEYDIGLRLRLCYGIFCGYFCSCSSDKEGGGHANIQ